MQRVTYNLHGNQDLGFTLTLLKNLHGGRLTISRHGPHVRPVHDALVLLCKRLDVALAEVEDLLPQHGAALVAGPLLDGEVQQHHAPDEPEADQEEAQLLRRQLPHEDRRHAELAGSGTD